VYAGEYHAAGDEMAERMGNVRVNQRVMVEIASTRESQDKSERVAEAREIRYVASARRACNAQLLVRPVPYASVPFFVFLLSFCPSLFR